MIAHIVLFEPKSGVSADQLRSFAKLLRSCAREIPSVTRAVVGRTVAQNVNKSSGIGDQTYSQAYGYAAVFEFADKAGLQNYFKHQAHQELAGLFWEVCEATIIVDVEMSDIGTGDLGQLLALRPN
jgi:Stress responsive A/B Barrel Domain